MARNYFNVSRIIFSITVKGKVDFPQIGLEKGTTERGIPKVSKSCQHYKFLSIF